MEKVAKVVSENKIVIFSKSTCCLCYAVQILFRELGAAPWIEEVDKIKDDPEARKEVEKALVRMGYRGPLPAVFIGGKLVGSMNDVMSLHLSGSLMPLLPNPTPPPPPPPPRTSHRPRPHPHPQPSLS